MTLCISSLIKGSIETTASFLEALLLHLALNPDIQEKIQQEIDEEIGAVADFGMAHFNRFLLQRVLLNCCI